jgi:hypothetical protein
VPTAATARGPAGLGGAEEIEAALARDVTVIPVLVDGARMPAPSELPTALESLGFRQAISLRQESFATDVAQTVRTLVIVAVAAISPSSSGRCR